MPLIFEGRCSACEAVTPRTSDGYMAVYVDEPALTHAHPCDPNLVILAHPGESWILKEIGYSFEAASLGGRLVSVAKVFCQACGQPFEIRRLTAGLGAFGCVGCFALVVGGVAAIVGVKSLLGNWIGYLVGCAVFVLLMTVAESAVVRFVRSKYPERVARLDTPAICPHCGSPKYSRPGSLRGLFPCVACGQKAVRFRIVGKS
jgi:transcription elongation factor Elf1